LLDEDVGESGEMAFARKPGRAGMFVETGIKKFHSSGLSRRGEAKMGRSEIVRNVLGSATVPVAV